MLHSAFVSERERSRRAAMHGLSCAATGVGAAAEGEEGGLVAMLLQHLLEGSDGTRFRQQSNVVGAAHALGQCVRRPTDTLPVARGLRLAIQRATEVLSAMDAAAAAASNKASATQHVSARRPEHSTCLPAHSTHAASCHRATAIMCLPSEYGKVSRCATVCGVAVGRCACCVQEEPEGGLSSEYFHALEHKRIIATSCWALGLIGHRAALLEQTHLVLGIADTLVAVVCRAPEAGASVPSYLWVNTCRHHAAFALVRIASDPRLPSAPSLPIFRGVSAADRQLHGMVVEAG